MALKVENMWCGPCKVAYRSKLRRGKPLKGCPNCGKKEGEK
jgi:hypothetical protein